MLSLLLGAKNIIAPNPTLSYKLKLLVSDFALSCYHSPRVNFLIFPSDLKYGGKISLFPSEYHASVQKGPFPYCQNKLHSLKRGDFNGETTQIVQTLLPTGRYIFCWEPDYFIEEKPYN
jgi:hypothetical protein